MAEKFTKEQIFDELKKILVEELEINDGDIVPEANLFEDLDLDSIDAVDIAVRMQKFTDKKLSPAEFKKIRTVNDVVEAVYGLLREKVNPACAIYRNVCCNCPVPFY